MFSNDWVHGVTYRREQIGYTRIFRRARAHAGIAERHARITNQPAPLGALDGTAAKNLAKVFFAQGREPFQVRMKEGFLGVRRRRRKLLGITFWIRLRLSFDRAHAGLQRGK